MLFSGVGCIEDSKSPRGNNKNVRSNRILHELKHHIPYTVFSVALGIIIVSLITVFLMNIVSDESSHDELAGDISTIIERSENDEINSSKAMKEIGTLINTHQYEDELHDTETLAGKVHQVIKEYEDGYKNDTTANTAMAEIEKLLSDRSSALKEHDDNDDHDHEGVSGVFSDIFHVFHPIHVLFSATATTAMFRRYDKKIYKAAIVGAVGALGVCAISDIFFPYIGGLISGAEMELHVCLVEDPMSIIPFTVFGIIVGLFAADVFSERKSTIFSHSGHIFISTMASLLYLTAYGFSGWMQNMFSVFLILILAVFIPCCISDIIFPLLFVNPENAPGCVCAPEKGYYH